MKITRFALTAVLWIGLLETTRAAADTHYVATNGSHGTPFITWTTASTTIQAAVDASAANDTVLVSNGAYYCWAAAVTQDSVTFATSMVSVTKSITIQSVNGPEATIVNANYPTFTNRCFLVYNASAVISGFTITNGYALAGDRNGYGGGVYVEASSGNIITNCLIAGNRAIGSGGGVAGGGKILNCQIVGNSAGAGGGISAAQTIIKDCIIERNVTSWGGGGVILTTDSGSIISNCLISSNYAGDMGGGIFFNSGDGNLAVNCTIISNRAAGTGGGGVATYGGGGTLRNCLISTNWGGNGGVWVYMCYVGGIIFRIENCTIARNSKGVYDAGGVEGDVNIVNTIIYSNYPNWTTNSMRITFTNCCTTPTNNLPGINNITNEPQFVDPAAWNFRLALGSPCINAGIMRDWMSGTAVDLDGRRRVDRFSGRPDMGCYELAPRGTMIRVR